MRKRSKKHLTCVHIRDVTMARGTAKKCSLVQVWLYKKVSKLRRRICCLLKKKLYCEASHQNSNRFRILHTTFRRGRIQIWRIQFSLIKSSRQKNILFFYRTETTLTLYLILKNATGKWSLFLSRFWMNNDQNK
jgi:hypothetical protein